MLVEIECVGYEKGHVVLHTHIHRVFYHIKGYILGIRVAGAVHCIVKAERPLFLIRIAKNKFEKTIFVFPINFSV